MQGLISTPFAPVTEQEQRLPYDVMIPGKGFYIINALTFYRLVASLALLYCIITHQPQIFKWLLAISLFTDAIDGTLARKFHVSSVMGAQIDSIADDLTILMAIIAQFVFKPGFVREESLWFIVLITLYLLQTLMAVIRYGKISAFHTYSAKIAAVLQGIFLVLLFFLPHPPTLLFYFAAIFTALEIVEEMILVVLLPQWRTNVKGLYWIIQEKKENLPT